MTSLVTIRERGTITEIKCGIMKLAGLPGCVLGQLMELSPDVKGLVIGFTETEVLALTLGPESSLSVGQRVDVRQQPLRVAVGPRWVGRVVSPLGEPLDGGPRPEGDALQPLFREAPGVMERAPVEDRKSVV